MEPFDPRDARDLFLDVLKETSTPAHSRSERVEPVAHLLAVAAESGVLSTAAALDRFYLLAVGSDYPDHEEVMHLYGLSDEWKGGWGRKQTQIAAEVREITKALASRYPAPPQALVTAVARA